MPTALAVGFRVGMPVSGQGERRTIAGVRDPSIRAAPLAYHLKALALRGSPGNERSFRNVYRLGWGIAGPSGYLGRTATTSPPAGGVVVLPSNTWM